MVLAVPTIHFAVLQSFNRTRCSLICSPCCLLFMWCLLLRCPSPLLAPSPVGRQQRLPAPLRPLWLRVVPTQQPAGVQFSAARETGVGEGGGEGRRDGGMEENKGGGRRKPNENARWEQDQGASCTLCQTTLCCTALRCHSITGSVTCIGCACDYACLISSAYVILLVSSAPCPSLTPVHPRVPGVCARVGSRSGGAQAMHCKCNGECQSHCAQLIHSPSPSLSTHIACREGAEMFPCSLRVVSFWPVKQRFPTGITEQ